MNGGLGDNGQWITKEGEGGGWYRLIQWLGSYGSGLTPDCYSISQADGNAKFTPGLKFFPLDLDRFWKNMVCTAPFYYTIFKIIGKQTLYNDGILESIYIRGELNIGETRPILILSDGLTWVDKSGQNNTKYIPTNTATAARWQIAGSDYANAANSSEFFSEYLWSGSMKFWK